MAPISRVGKLIPPLVPPMKRWSIINPSSLGVAYVADTRVAVWCVCFVLPFLANNECVPPPRMRTPGNRRWLPSGRNPRDHAGGRGVGEGTKSEGDGRVSISSLQSPKMFRIQPGESIQLCSKTGLHAEFMAASHAPRPIWRRRPALQKHVMLPHSVGATGAVRALGAVVMGAEVDSLAAERAAVVDEFLVLLDGHVG